MKTLEPINPKDRDPNLVFIGVPSVGGGLWDLARTIISLENGAEELAAGGVKERFTFQKAAGQGVAKARNMLTFAARCTRASKIIMVDADIRPTPADFLRLAAAPEPLVGALYPKKNFFSLCWVGEFHDAKERGFGRDGLWPMMHVGSGFIKVDLSLVDELIAAFPEREYLHDEDEPTSGIEDGQLMHDLWGMGVVKAKWFGSRKHPEPRVYPRYVTEDYYFSHLASKLGVKLWTDPAVQVGHVGEVDFLALHNHVDRRIEAALAAYKRDLQSVGVKVPVLERTAEGNVRVARVN